MTELIEYVMVTIRHPIAKNGFFDPKHDIYPNDREIYNASDEKIDERLIQEYNENSDYYHQYTKCTANDFIRWTDEQDLDIIVYKNALACRKPYLYTIFNYKDKKQLKKIKKYLGKVRIEKLYKIGYKIKTKDGHIDDVEYSCYDFDDESAAERILKKIKPIQGEFIKWNYFNAFSDGTRRHCKMKLLHTQRKEKSL